MSAIRHLTVLFIAVILTVTWFSKENAASETPQTLYGFANSKGELAVPCKFVTVGSFSEGLAPVMVHNQLGDTYGFINTEGNFVINPRFLTAGDFSEGLAAVSSGSKNLIGYINKNGQSVLPEKYWWGGPFHKGLAIVVFSGEQHGSLIDKTGKILLRDVLDIGQGSSNAAQPGPGAFLDSAALELMVPKFEDGPIPNYRHQFIDEKGNIVISREWMSACRFHEGLAAVQVDEASGKFGFVNKSGKLVIPPKYISASPFSEGLAFVREEVTSPRGGAADVILGYIDKTGKMVIRREYENNGDFHNGLASVCIINSYGQRKWGFIDRRGRVLIETNFDSVSDFSENLAAVYADPGLFDQTLPGGWGFINRDGKFISDTRFNAYAGRFENGFAPVGIRNVSGENQKLASQSWTTLLYQIVFAAIVIAKSEIIRRFCSLPKSELDVRQQSLAYMVSYSAPIVAAGFILVVAAFGVILGLAMANNPVNASMAYWGFVCYLEAFATPVLSFIAVQMSWGTLKIFKASRSWKRAVAAYFVILAVEYALILVGLIFASALQPS